MGRLEKKLYYSKTLSHSRREESRGEESRGEERRGEERRGDQKIDYPFRSWSWRLDSNQRPADYKSAALPTELRQLKLAAF